MDKRKYYKIVSIILLCLLGSCLMAPTSWLKTQHDASRRKEDNSSREHFAIPKATIILLAVLGALLIIMLVIYFLLGLPCCDWFSPSIQRGKNTEKISNPSPKPTRYTKLDTTEKPEPLFDSDDEDEIKLLKRNVEEISSHSLRTTGVETGSAQSLNQVWPQGDLALGDSASVLNQTPGETLRPRTSTQVSDSLEKFSARDQPGRRQSSVMEMDPDPSDQVDSRFPITAGRVRVAISFSPSSDKLEVTVVRVEDIPEAMVRQERATMVEVHVALFPRKQRFKTRSKPDRNAIFNETFTIRRLSQDAVFNCLLRFRLYGRVKGKDNFLGEATYSLKDLDIHDIDTNLWLTFAPRSGLLS